MNQIMLMLEDEYRQSVLRTLASLGQGLPPGVDPLNVIFDPSVLGGGESSEGGSDSSDSDGPPVQLQWRGKKEGGRQGGQEGGRGGGKDGEGEREGGREGEREGG